MAEYTFTEIPYGSELYQASTALRDRVLRQPLGLSLYDENLTAERDDWHIGVMDGKKLIGILVLTRLDHTSVKMRQVAVDEAYRGKGVGRDMARYAESFAQSRGMTTIKLHARESAIPFYLKMGYVITSDTFTEVSLPHKAMEKAFEY